MRTSIHAQLVSSLNEKAHTVMSSWRPRSETQGNSKWTEQGRDTYLLGEMIAISQLYSPRPRGPRMNDTASLEQPNRSDTALKAEKSPRSPWEYVNEVKTPGRRNWKEMRHWCSLSLWPSTQATCTSSWKPGDRPGSPP